jgi:type III restriction enzyme
MEFTKHLAPGMIGHMNDEEEDCALAIDHHKGVAQWVRNIERQTSSFRLRVSNQWFYPDFIAQMTDGSYVVVEYKGAGTEGPADRTDEKDAVGRKWAETTGNRFAMVKDKDWAALQQALDG